MMADPHIVHVVPNETGGGAERLVCDLQAGLLARGLSVERVHFCGDHVSGPAVTRFGNREDSPLNIWQLRRLLKNRCERSAQPIILHSHLTHGFYVCLIASAGLPVRWVHTEHSTTMRLREIRWMRPIERRLYMHCDKVVAISRAVQKALETSLRLPENHIAYLPNGAQGYGVCDRQALGPREIRFVSVGSLTERKGFDIALHALARASIGAWHYTIVGEGPELSNLKDIADKLGVSQRVTFAGWSDPGPHYRRADLQLIPSRWEGFGLVAVEGMSTGLRVVASDVDGLREVLGCDPEVGTLIGNHLDHERWVSALESSVAALSHESSTTSRSSVERAQLFTIEKMLDEHVSFYVSLALTG